jgi:hypothetical protein
MASAAFALQSAIYARLLGDAGLTAMLGGSRVYDDVPARAEFPYLTFGQSIERDWSTGTDDGKEHTITLHVWSRAAGRKESDDIIEVVRGLLHDAALTLSGHRLVNLRHEVSDVRRDPSGDTFHGLARFRAVTEPI